MWGPERKAGGRVFCLPSFEACAALGLHASSNLTASTQRESKQHKGTRHAVLAQGHRTLWLEAPEPRPPDRALVQQQPRLPFRKTGRMLNNLFRTALGNRQQQQTAPVAAKQHAAVKDANADTPTRRALAPVSGTQVNSMTRSKASAAAPAGFTVATDVPHLTASAKKVGLRCLLIENASVR